MPRIDGFRGAGISASSPVVAGYYVATSALTAANQSTGDKLIFDNNGITGTAMASDTAPQGLLIRPQTSYAPGAQTAADLNLYGGQDETKITIDDYAQGVDGDTVALIWTNGSGTTTTSTFTGRTGTPGANEFKIETSSAVTATNLAAAITTALGASGIIAAATSTVAYITIASNVAKIRMTESRAAFTTVSVGTNGYVVFQGWLGVTFNTETAVAGIGTQGSAGGVGFTMAKNSQTLGHTWSEGFELSTSIGSTVIARLDSTSGFQHNLGNWLPTAGTMGGSTVHVLRTGWNAFTWTNAMVVALGASLTGDITVCTLKAKTLVTRCIVVITGAATGVATLTVAVGRTGAGYIDYVVASDAKAAANTVYGDAAAEQGTNLQAAGATGKLDDFPSYTATTDVKAHFISTVQNLDQTVGSTGIVFLRTEIIAP